MIRELDRTSVFASASSRDTARRPALKSFDVGHSGFPGLRGLCEIRESADGTVGRKHGEIDVSNGLNVRLGFVRENSDFRKRRPSQPKSVEYFPLVVVSLSGRTTGPRTFSTPLPARETRACAPIVPGRARVPLSV